MKAGIYIHVPFCRKKCSYCSFYSIPVDIDKNDRENLIERYLERLIIEIRGRSSGFRDYIIDTIYFGGGTPSLLNEFQVSRIIGTISSNYNLDDRAEITLECNPEDFSIENISGYKTSGINRVILGVQTIDKKSHSVIGRSARLVTLETLSDFYSVKDIIHCIDLIICIPGQTPEGLLRDLASVCRYRWEHISMYSLSIEPGTDLFNRGIERLTGDAQRRLMENSIDFLKNTGYTHYEISNFALPSCESRHNLKYWNYMPYIGFGAGAHSFYSGSRYYNPPVIRDYLKDIFFLKEDIRGENSNIVEYILTSMRLLKGMSCNNFKIMLGMPFPDEIMDKARLLEKRGYIIIEEGDDKIIRLTRDGFFILDSLIYEMTESFL